MLREQFKAFLDDQGLDRPHVAGNSLGGLVALIAGAEGDARSVTALSPAGFWRTEAQFRYTRGIFERACALADRVGGRTELLARTAAGRKLMYGVLTRPPGPGLARPGARRRPRASCAPARPCACCSRRPQPFDREIPLDVPVTVAWAARDLVLPPVAGGGRPRGCCPSPSTS